jgi:hypothetical protein
MEPINKNFEIEKISGFSSESIFVTKGQAEAVFCGLGENQWKQIYDAKWHHFGNMVFDTGEHHKITDEKLIAVFIRLGKTREKIIKDSIKPYREPGYFNSISKALKYAQDHLCEPLTSKFYCELHELACGHFEGQKNNTQMTAMEAGKFRHCDTKIKVNIHDILKFYESTTEPTHEKLLKEFCLARKSHGGVLSEEKLENLKEYYSIAHLTVSSFNELEAKLQTHLVTLQKYINEIEYKNSFLSNVFPKLSIDKGVLIVDYEQPKFNHIVDCLFSEFNQQMAKLFQLQKTNKPEEIMEKKLELIADLFQKLEWLHPFQDGQGRTDLILLSKLLSEYGFNPPILMEPYVSSYVPLNDWVKYLKEGMKDWQKLKNQD